MIGFAVERARACQDLAGAWARLTDASFYLTCKWLAGRSATLHAEPMFTIVSNADGTPAAGYPAYVVSEQSYAAYDPVAILTSAHLVENGRLGNAERRALERCQAALCQAWPSLHPALVVAAPGRAGGIAYRPGLAGERRREVAAAVVRSVLDLARERNLPVIAFLYAPGPADSALQDALAENGFISIQVDAESQLPIEWTTFDGYLQSFRSVRRSNLRREIARFRAADVRVEIAGAEALDEELAALERGWRRKYGRAIELEEIQAQHRAIQKFMPDETLLFIGRKGARAVGFAAFFQHGPVLYSRFGGFAYDAQDIFIYFNLLFYEPIRYAIDRGFRDIRYSTGAHATKVSRGCLLNPVYMHLLLPREVAAVAKDGLQVVDCQLSAAFSSLLRPRSPAPAQGDAQALAEARTRAASRQGGPAAGADDLSRRSR